MNPGEVAAALALAIGAVLAVSARDGRVAVLGLTVTLVAAPLVADPLPGVSALAIRVTGAILAAYLVLAALRGGPAVTLGTHLGWPVQAVVAVAAAVAGIGITGAAAGSAGQAAADPLSWLAASVGVGAGSVALILSIEPIVSTRDGLRLGIGLILALAGLGVVRTALLGTSGGLEQIVMAGAVVAVAAATAVVCVGAAAEDGDLSLSSLPSALRARRPGLRAAADSDRLEVDEP